MSKEVNLFEEEDAEVKLVEEEGDEIPEDDELEDDDEEFDDDEDEDEEAEEEAQGGFHEAEIPEVIEQISLTQDGQNRFQIKRVIEAVLFASPQPLAFNKIRDLVHTIEQLKPKEIRDLLAELAEEYEVQQRAFSLEEIAEGYVLRTKPEFSPHLDQVFRNKKVERLSHSATEVLAIIAYRQPMTRPQIEEIRGVDSSGVLASLLERQLIEVVGKLEVAGRPTLYGTTKLFLEHYGLRDVKDLPQYQTMRGNEKTTD